MLPQRKATAATAANIAEFEARRADLEKAAAERKASAETRAAQLVTVATTCCRSARLLLLPQPTSPSSKLVVLTWK
ncbi:hypothetical protein CQA20_29585, partial [Klebsiella pneumoniae]